EQVLVDEGDLVKAGQLMARLEHQNELSENTSPVSSPEFLPIPHTLSVFLS
ncbi:MAG: biotin/lipoyl-binding protein, partial [Symploca sp. SIO2B6]|nr:biotin/lipoyl-binding protein [Symploca sp. SIO2B6]